MLQTKIFQVPEDIKEFNDFVKSHPPTGTNGMKILPEYVMLTYENGELMSNDEKISHLVNELNTLTGNEIDEVRQYKDVLKMLSLIDFYKKKNDWAKTRDTLIPMRKNCELTALKMDIIVETLKDLRRPTEIEHPDLPELPEEPILAPKQK